MTYSFPFEKLEVWQAARRFVVDIYALTKEFPANEQYGLAGQIKRAAVSVASNLAEGTSRSSLKDQAHFSQLAFSSLMEVACQSVIALDLGFINEEKYNWVRQGIELLSKQLNALRSSQVKRAFK